MMSTCTIRIITLFFIGTVFSMKPDLFHKRNECFFPPTHQLLSDLCNQPLQISTSPSVSSNLTKTMCRTIHYVAEMLCHKMTVPPTIKQKLKEFELKFSLVEEANLCDNLLNRSKQVFIKSSVLFRMITEDCSGVCSGTRIILCKILSVGLHAYLHSSIIRTSNLSMPAQQTQSTTSKPIDTVVTNSSETHELETTTEDTPEPPSESNVIRTSNLSMPAQQTQSTTSKPIDTVVTNSSETLETTTEDTPEPHSESNDFRPSDGDHLSMPAQQTKSTTSKPIDTVVTISSETHELETTTEDTPEPPSESNGTVHTSDTNKQATSNQHTQEPSAKSNGDVLKQNPDDIDELSGIHKPTNTDTNSNVIQNSIKSTGQPPSSGHFMAYFLTIIVLCVAGYVVFHNKQKIIAFVVEGRSGQQRRRTDGGGEYKKLRSNVEEVMPSLDKTTASKNFIY